MSAQCQASKCHADFQDQTDSEARALGWMLWSGQTLGGKRSVVIYCPVHAGRTEAAAEAQETGFDAECETCFVKASEEWVDEFDGTEDAAEEWMQEHNCEPYTRLIRPKVKAMAS